MDQYNLWKTSFYVLCELLIHSLVESQDIYTQKVVVLFHISCFTFMWSFLVSLIQGDYKPPSSPLKEVIAIK